MGQTYERIEPRLQSFIEQQPIFFVATAPLAEYGHVNVSPKGRSGSLTVLGKTDDQFAAYCAAKPYNAVSLDGLPLPARSN